MSRLPELQVKGLAFRGVIAAAQRLLGDAVADKMLPYLPDELARAIRLNAILTGGWYPIAHYRALHAALGRVSGRGPELSRTLGHDATVDDFRGIYRVLAFVLSPEFLIRRAPGLWGRY